MSVCFKSLPGGSSLYQGDSIAMQKPVEVETVRQSCPRASTGVVCGEVLPGTKLAQTWHGSQGSALQVQLLDVSAGNQVYLKRLKSLMHCLVTQSKLLISDENSY